MCSTLTSFGEVLSFSSWWQLGGHAHCSCEGQELASRQGPRKDGPMKTHLEALGCGDAGKVADVDGLLCAARPVRIQGEGAIGTLASGLSPHTLILDFLASRAEK